MKNSKVARLVVAAGAIFAAASAQAGITDPGLMITASNANGSGTYQVFLSNGSFTTTNTLNDTWQWQSPVGGYDIFDDNFNVVAHVDNMFCKMVSDPQITINFTVNSTSLATHFTITSGVLSFGTINPAQGRAQAGITVTDNDSDGATLTGLHAGGNAYHADYNSGTTFGNYVTSFGVAADDTDTNDGNSAGYPGYVGIGGAVNDMSAVFDFNLSANDSASGTSFYEIIPAPSGLALVGAAGLVGLRRRR